jgi:branched-chain amino acid transport system permease protein
MADVAPALVDLANYLVPASIFALMALALNLQWGHTGLFNGGVAAFWAIGAYTAAILMTPFDPRSLQYPGHLGGFSQPFVIAAFAAIIVSFMVGLAITIPILRLRADYFAIATLALSEIVRVLLENAESLTAGTIGIRLIPRPFGETILGSRGISDLSMAALGVSALLITVFVLDYVTRSPWGRVLRGIREDEEATLALGKNVFSFRLQAFALGCAVLGLAGAIFATFQGFIAPNQFDPVATFGIYIMVILGGSGNNRGVVFGAFLFYGFDWASTRLKDLLPQEFQSAVPPIRLMVIGLLLVALVLYRPEGIFRERKRTYRPVA